MAEHVNSSFNKSSMNRKFVHFDDESEKDWKGDFCFIQAADTQFGMLGEYIKKEKNYGWKEEVLWSRQLVKEINEMVPAPKFLVICGDLVDAWPETAPENREKQESDFKEVFKDVKIPLVCVCGNHDVGNQPSVETVTRYRSSFGDDFFSFWCGGVYFIVLNSQFYVDPSRVEEMAAEQDRWLDRELETVKKERPKHTVVFQHVPIFLSEPTEEDQYFNLPQGLRIKLLNKLYDAGVRYVFTGHYHRNAGGKFKSLELVVTSAVGVQLGDDKHGYRIVNVTETDLKHEYCDLDVQ